MGIEHLGDGGVEQLLLALEVVVERPHPHIGRLGDLQNRHIDLARGDERLRSLDQRGARTLLAPYQSVDGPLSWICHVLTVAEKLSFEDFLRCT